MAEMLCPAVQSKMMCSVVQTKMLCQAVQLKSLCRGRCCAIEPYSAGIRLANAKQPTLPHGMLPPRCPAASCTLGSCRSARTLRRRSHNPSAGRSSYHARRKSTNNGGSFSVRRRNRLFDCEVPLLHSQLGTFGAADAFLQAGQPPYDTSNGMWINTEGTSNSSPTSRCCCEPVMATSTDKETHLADSSGSFLRAAGAKNVDTLFTPSSVSGVHSLM